ncbi:MAG: CotH kinase family protein [Bacteroidota bacterium]
MKKAYFFFAFSLCLLFIQSQVVINEYSCANKTITDNFGSTPDWVELFNPGTTAASIGGFYLSDNPNTPMKWQIPSGASIPSGGFLRIWCSGKDTLLAGNYHAGFKLQQCKPDYIVLSNGSGGFLDSVYIRRHQTGHSWGRMPNGSSSWKLFTTPTSNSSNGTSGIDAYAKKPVFSVAPGFYSGAQSVSISTTELNSSIRYTTNGNEPTSSSTLYTGPVSISATTVLRAKVFSSNPAVFESFIETNTYFINQTYSMPVVSICGDQLLTLMNGNNSIVPKPNLEYFDENKTFLYETYGEADKHGNDSWAFNQRGIDFIADDEYGYNYTNPGQFFTNPKLGVSSRDRFDKIILKAGASDNYPGDSDPSCHMRDAFVQSYAFRKGLELDGRRYEPCILFVNGSYWGIYEWREKFDTDYTDYYYDQPEDEIDNLKFWGGLNIEDGSDTGWVNIYNFVMNNNMGIASNYAYVDSKLSIKSLIDYMVYNSYVMNSDFINWNSAWWRGRNPNGDKKKWRYWMWDMDNVYNLGENFSGLPTTSWNLDPCDYASTFPPSSGPNQGHPAILDKLMNENDTVKSMYINRYADLINTALQCDSILDHHAYFLSFLTPEMPAHIAKWGGSMANWQSRVALMDSMIRMRCTFIDSAIQNCYNVTPFPLTVDVQPPGAGWVKANTAVPSYYPWTANYYATVFMNFTALPNSNYKFDHWEFKTHPIPGNNPQEDTLLNYVFDTTEYVTAFFKLKEPYELSGEVIVPTGFTPNGDGLNDFLYPYGTLYVSGLEFEVFNRWGQKVFSTNDKTKGWDGTFQGTEAPAGVYAYRLKAITESKVIQTSGNVTLIR